MALIACEEQLEAEAARVNDVATSEPLAGLFTVTAANAWAARTASSGEARVSFSWVFI
jgi:hypothetical protein